MTSGPDVRPDDVHGMTADLQLPESPRGSMEIAGVQMLAASGVQHSLAFAFWKLTGHEEPTARDADVPLGRILVWAATSAAAVAIVNVPVDRLVLRPRGN